MLINNFLINLACKRKEEQSSNDLYNLNNQVYKNESSLLSQSQLKQQVIPLNTLTTQQEQPQPQQQQQQQNSPVQKKPRLVFTDIQRRTLHVNIYFN